MSTNSHTEQHIEVDVPVRVAYNQWTNFEEFPNFMGGVKSVQKKGSDTVHFTVEVGPKTVDYDAKIVDQIPDERVSWKSIDGKENIGVVTFNSLGANKTRVGLRMQYEVDGLDEQIGDMLGFVSRRAKGDLDNFKEYVEDRTKSANAWRNVN